MIYAAADASISTQKRKNSIGWAYFDAQKGDVVYSGVPLKTFTKSTQKVEKEALALVVKELHERFRGKEQILLATDQDSLVKAFNKGQLAEQLKVKAFMLHNIEIVPVKSHGKRVTYTDCMHYIADGAAGYSHDPQTSFVSRMKNLTEVDGFDFSKREVSIWEGICLMVGSWFR